MAEEKKTTAPRQIMRYTNAEVSLIKATFKDNYDAFMALRKYFLELPMDTIDRQIIDKLISSEDTLALLRKTYLPDLDAKAPIHQVIDLYLTLDIKDKGVEQSFLAITSREILIKFIDERLAALEEGKYADKTFEIYLSDLTNITGYNPEEAVSRMSARNSIIHHCEQQIAQLQVLSLKEDEPSEEEAKEKKEQDSAK